MQRAYLQRTMATANASISDEDSGSASYSDYSLLGVFTHPLPVEIVISTIVWLMCFLAVTGNVLVFVVILRDKQLRSNVANMYIMNLASADLCVGLNSLTLNNLWRYFGNWPFRRGLCTFWTILDSSACLQAAFAVTLISLDRYMLVTKYLQYRKYQTKKLAGLLIAGTWSISLFFYAMPILGNELWVNARAYGTVNYLVTCDFGVYYILSYNIAQIAVGFVLPTLMLAYLNYGVYSNILKRSKGFVRSTGTGTGPSAADPALLQASVLADSSGNVVETRRTYRKHRKAAITLALIVGTFALCWVPYYIVQLLFVVDKIKFTWLLWNSVYYTIWVNSAINPFIYVATSPRMRRSFLQIICFWNRRLLRKIHAV